MNLESLMLRRAEEQASVRGALLPHNSPWRDAPKPRAPKPARNSRVTCECGTCVKCRRREGMRRYRASLPKAPPKPMGPKMTLGRRCDCGSPISNTNGSGMCQRCWRNDYRREKTAQMRAERQAA
jgi:hypothetical protein